MRVRQSAVSREALKVVANSNQGARTNPDLLMLEVLIEGEADGRCSLREVLKCKAAIGFLTRGLE